MDDEKVFQGENGEWGIGSNGSVTYESQFTTEAEAQAILAAHNDGAKTYDEAVMMAFPKMASELARLRAERDALREVVDLVSRYKEEWLKPPSQGDEVERIAIRIEMFERLRKVKPAAQPEGAASG